MLSERLARLNVPPTAARSVRLENPSVFATMRAVFDGLKQGEVEAFVESLESEFPDSISSLDEAKPLTWEMLKVMSDAGMTIGSHTKSHSLLTGEEGDRLAQEIVQSKDALQRRLGSAPRHFAYPDGR